MGSSPRSSAAILALSMSTQMTSLPESAKQVPATRPTYPEPMMASFMSSPEKSGARYSKSRRGQNGRSAPDAPQHRARLQPAQVREQVLRRRVGEQRRLLVDEPRVEVQGLGAQPRGVQGPHRRRAEQQLRLDPQRAQPAGHLLHPPRALAGERPGQ